MNMILVPVIFVLAVSEFAQAKGSNGLIRKRVPRGNEESNQKHKLAMASSTYLQMKRINDLPPSRLNDDFNQRHKLPSEDAEMRRSNGLIQRVLVMDEDSNQAYKQSLPQDDGRIRRRALEADEDSNQLYKKSFPQDDNSNTRRRLDEDSNQQYKFSLAQGDNGQTRRRLDEDSNQAYKFSLPNDGRKRLLRQHKNSNENLSTVAEQNEHQSKYVEWGREFRLDDKDHFQDFTV